ncbi:MAG: hypothetical protein AVDCRST_MAG68-3369 [uncultured Gemmatimonadetes bacterium]|uniref:Uncharacterized protein n=1 Tax=uncultured Gemmatimonadota bacterium TaxID=203437 RepID=A0A6J4LMD7_9BACT|nr:MAG: hypothetical protein AVDCRST_MAG68-3369 [uncultured Gemmatimonadota bacterium]
MESPIPQNPETSPKTHKKKFQPLSWPVREENARTRMEREMQIVEHLRTTRARECFIGRIPKLRPELMVRALRTPEALRNDAENGLSSGCLRGLFGPVDAANQSPRAAWRIHRKILRMSVRVSYMRAPMQEADLEDFSQAAYTMILSGVLSRREGDRLWEEIFRVALHRRLQTLVRNTRVQRGRQGRTGNPNKGESFARMPPMLVLDEVSDHTGLDLRDPARGERLARAVEALRAALAKMHPYLQDALEVDAVGRLVKAGDVAHRYGKTVRTVKDWRKRARQLFRQDAELVALLQELGYCVKDD